MIPEIGLYSLVLAMLVAAAQSVVPMWGAATSRARPMAFASSAAITQFLLVGASFVCLMWSFATSDFSLRVVAENSHTAKPLFYKIGATWGQHEGSMLLWTLVLSLFGAAVAVFGNQLPVSLKARALAVQGMIGLAFLAFLIFTSNPFERLDPAPLEGNGFNPLLQDPGLVGHPPTLYVGYVGFSIAYSFSIAALIEGRVDAAWARWVRPWILLAWSFLGLGITMGSLWAYYELGWGGWWFWDPVENASFMPWLIGTALLHSALVVERRHGLVNWTLLLSILTFTLSLIGTFLVRSGVLTSVHAFAVDPKRGVFILAMILTASGGALLLYAIRARAIRQGPPFAAVSREGAILGNNMLLLIATAIVFLGTFYPLLIDALTKDKISVGPPYFDQTFAPLMLVVAGLMAFGPSIRWRRDEPKAAARTLGWPALAALAVAIASGFIGRSIPGALGFGMASFIVFGLVRWFLQRTRLGQAPLRQSLNMARAFPGATWGFMGSHLGFAVVMFGVTAMSAWSTETTSPIAVGGSVKLGDYAFTLQKIEPVPGANYEAQRMSFAVTHNGKPDGEIACEDRYYPERDQTTTEAGIRPGFLYNLYVAGQQIDDGTFNVRVNHHPLAMWLWAGGLLVAGGGFVSLADRRFRVGAPNRAPAIAAAQA